MNAWGWALVALPFVASILASVDYRARVRRRFPPVGHIVEAAGVRLHVEVRGSGPAVLLVHGAAGVLQDYPNVMRHALAKEFTVIAVDRPGHGYSSHGPRRLDVAGNIVALRAALRALGHHRVILVGHSYGAVLALRWALEAPHEVAAVVAISPASQPYAKLARFALVPFLVPLLGDVLAWTLALPAGSIVALFARRHAWHPQRVPIGLGSAARAFPLVATHFKAFLENAQAIWTDVRSQYARYPQGRAPLVVVVGEGDLVTPAARHALPLVKHWGGPVELSLLPAAGHMLLRSHAEDVVAAVRRAQAMAVTAGAH